MLWLALQTSLVQNWLVGKVTRKLSKDLNTTVSIRHVDFSLFNNMHLEGVLVRDHQKDTLLYAGQVTVNITDWFFLKDNVVLKKVALSDATVQIGRTDSVWNYQFLVDYFGGGTKSGNAKPIQLDLKNVSFDRVVIRQLDGWRGEDMIMDISSLQLDADKLDLQKKLVRVKTINLKKLFYTIRNYPGKRPPLPDSNEEEEKIVNDPQHLRWNKAGWDIAIEEVNLEDSRFKSYKDGVKPDPGYFEGKYIDFTDINGKFRNVKWVNDTIFVKTSLSTRERSGFVVTQLTADTKIHPEAMEFHHLDLHTPRSRLRDFFAMRYNTFDDMSDFISKVRMEANFTGANVSSDDIAYFAPALQTFKRSIRVEGKVKGTVEDLQAKSLVLEAGNSTYLNGDIRITGLPEIDKTYIDFEANNFRTTYTDAVTLVPQLKKLTNPRLDLLKYLRFKGNFAGFVNDFVTYGSLETALGTLITDVNMKFPPHGLPRYSGTIKTDNFELGTFIEMPALGGIAFNGKINGSGLENDKVNAELDGLIHRLEYNDYAYQNISVKGNVAKMLFNGQLISNDPNLDASLVGLIDFSKKIPTFDFNASIAKADLMKINLTKENIEFSGKFRFDFSGNNIDNFLGTARVYNANVLRNGTRLSFDSLFVESKILDSNKVITVVSNEFDAALVGDFSIEQLPDAFQNFLNKYYPSYIKPSRKVLRNEDFSFVITTKNIQDYLDLFVKDLGGFNNTTITGRINNKENLLDLNAEIPQFSYKNISLYNLTLKGAGDLQKLTLQTNIGDVYINDSLHFPGTYIDIKSSNDVSEVKVNTSASQTLNAANISGQVTTRRDGVSIRFNESNFDINGKNWTIQENGELILSKELVAADGLKIFNGQQEIRITSVPSDIGSSNDIRVDLQKINIGDFTPYVVTTNRLEGLLTGSVDIIDPFGKMQVDMNGETEQFRLDDDSIGRIQLSANYNQKTGVVNFKTHSDNVDYHFDVKGNYSILDTNSAHQLDLTTDLNNTRINLLKRYLNSVFSDVTGYATGQLRIVGRPDDLNYLGNIKLKDGRLTVGYTNVTYTIPSANFDFKEGLIDFGNFAVLDTFKNVGILSRGKLRHRGFKDMDFDFAMNTSKLLVLNTNSNTKDLFYGKVIAKTNMTFSGPMEDMVMNIKAEPADSSAVFIRSGSSRQSGQADFIVWKTYGREMEAVRSNEESKLTVLLDVNTNRLANFNVIIDELTNDIMSARGHGNLKLQANTAGQFNMTGQYDIDEGKYNFNFQSLLHKPFTLKDGSNIRWSGNPTDADLNVTAEYLADGVKFSDLGDQVYAQGGDMEYIKKIRGKVMVQAKITGKLMKPDIDFSLEMQDPQLKNDPIVLNMLRDIQADRNELNKQVAFLIIFNSFGPRSTSSQNGLGNLAVEGIVSSSISGYISSALSKQFSNIIRKIFNDESIKVNFNAQLYNGSNFLANNTGNSAFVLDRTNVNFSLAKSVFNERLTFTFGSALDFGLTAAQARAANSLQFLPDITAELKLRPDGKLLLTFFYRDSYNYQSATGKQNRSGAGISYRRDFESFGDLWRSDRKKKKKTPVAPVAIPQAGAQ